MADGMPPGVGLAASTSVMPHRQSPTREKLVARRIAVCVDRVSKLSDIEGARHLQCRALSILVVYPGATGRVGARARRHDLAGDVLQCSGTFRDRLRESP